MDDKKLKISLRENKREFIESKVFEIIPLLEGLTINEVKETFDIISGTLNDSVPLKFEYYQG